jgi:hypothetical protein
VFIATATRVLKGANVSTDPTAITSIETYALAVPLARPIADSTAAMSHWTVPIVNIQAPGLVAAVSDGWLRFGGWRGVAVVAARGSGDDLGL